MILNKKSAAQFYTYTRTHAIQSDLFYFSLSILLIAFQTGFIISKEMSEIYIKNETKLEKLDSSIMNPDSIINNLSSFFDITVNLRRLSPSSFIILQLVLLLICWFFLLSFMRFDIIKKAFGIRNHGKSAVMYFLSTIILNFDIIFFILNIIGFNSLPCRKIWVEATKGRETNFLEETSEVNSEFAENFDRSTSKFMVQINVTFISDTIECQSLNHMTTMVLAVLIFISNFSLKYIACKLMNYVPSRSLYLCKYGNSDLIFDAVLTLVMILNTTMQLFFQDSYDIIRVVYVFYFWLLIMAFVINNYFQPFFNQMQHRLKSLQILYLVNISFFSILVRETDFILVNTEVGTMILMLISLSLLIKINNNLSRIDPGTLFKEAHKQVFRHERRIMKIFYLMIGHIDKLIKEQIDSKVKVSVEQEIEIYLDFLLSKHLESCVKVHCFCNDSEVFQRRHRLGLFKDKLQKTSVIQLMILLEDLLKRCYNSNKEQHEATFYCLEYYLINYMGKNMEAFTLLNERIEINNQCVKNKTKISMGEFAVMDNCLTLCTKNLRHSNLSLLYYPHMTNECMVDRKTTYYWKHLTMINRIEKMKRRILLTIDLRIEFLKTLSSKGTLKRCYGLGVKFYTLTRLIFVDYEFLSNHTCNEYAPLMLIFGQFLYHVYQNKYKGQKLLGEYQRKQGKSNLNRIFSKQELSEYEFSCIIVEKTKESFQTIKYSSSNMSKFLGYTVAELEGEELDILIPSPIKSFHRQFFDPERIGGRLFMSKDLLKMYAVNIEGFLVPFGLAIRFNNNILQGLEIIGVMNFYSSKPKTNILMLNDKGYITRFTGGSQEYFNRGIHISMYNKDFKEVFKPLGIVIKEKLLLKENTNDFEYIFTGDKLEAWNLYCEWKYEKKLNVFTKNKEMIQLNIRLKEYLIHSLDKYFWFLEYEIHDMRTQLIMPEADNFQKYKYGSSNQNKMQEKSLYDYMFERKNEKRKKEKQKKQILKFCDKTTKINRIRKSMQANKIELDNLIIEESNRIIEAEKGGLPSPFLGTNDDQINNNPLAIFEAMKEANIQEFNEGEKVLSKELIEYQKEKEELDMMQLIKTKTNIDCYFKENVNQLFEDQEIIRIAQRIDPSNTSDLDNTIKIPTNSLLASKGITKKKFAIQEYARLKTNKSKKIKKKEVNKNGASSGSSVINKGYKEASMELLIHSYIKPNKVHFSTILTTLMIIILSTLHIYSSRVKAPIQEGTNLELKAQIPTADIWSWVIWSHLANPWHMDIMRAIKEGLIENNQSMVFGIDNQMNESWDLFNRSVAYKYDPDRALDIKMRNLTYIGLYEYERWISSTAVANFYTIDQKTGGIMWEDKIMGRAAYQKMLNAFALNYRGHTNYSSVDKPILKGDRNNDPDEEFFRKNLNNDLNKVYAELARDFFNFLTKVSQQNQQYILYSMLASVVGNLIILLIFGIYFIREIVCMKSFYSQLFRVYVSLLFNNQLDG